MGLIVRAIDNRKEVNKFIDAQYLFYKNDKNFVAPLKMDRQKLLSIDKNPFFKHSEIQMFLAERGGKVVCAQLHAQVRPVLQDFRLAGETHIRGVHR